MPDLYYLILGLAALTVMVLCVGVAHLTKSPSAEAVAERLQRIRAPDRAPARKIDPRLEKTLSSLGRLTAPKEPQQLSTLRKRLSYAGYRGQNAALYFFGIKAIGAIAMGGIALFYSLTNAQSVTQDLITITAATALGLYAPNYWVRLKTSRRNDAMSKALPNTLDLLVVCVEAGLGLDMALKRVGEEIAATAPELAKELSLVSLEMNTGIPRQKALANLGERNSLDELKSLATIMVQADKFGTSVGHALRVAADSIRTKRRQAAEERAAKTTVKLTFPLVLFILPATFIIVIGPGILKLAQSILPQLAR